jgi:L-ascorbate metabolism protein UlaG (beta-lactamase superfamily)
VELTFNGHACVTLRSADGRVILMDPYQPGAFGGRISHAAITERADIVTVSHYHVDHSHVTDAMGDPAIVDASARAAGLSFVGRPTYHDRERGARMGMTTMIVVEIDGLRVAHLGDIGCELTPDDVSALGRVDVLLWPVGGTYTLGPEDAAGVLDALKPRLAIPLHFEHARCQLGMEPVDTALAALGAASVPWTRSAGSAWSSAQGLPAATTVMALEPAR